ncbi:enoyl-CoA hydratase [Pseudooctadecabacter jejudonensis]|uniref:Enoyl-CoA hydratase domain-containing protein 3, mitochondrial n=1 Tax=Pseudooctadecabacter jejudonensis TaxID=1391910 RepID=A0A1Y5RDW8_9RHOB|nr:enoyl-CoA hydratase [Pseudooctadecabacter jejudonensis]SLN15165.1 putative enoyl-CoA hydratase echA8 [Pseudooctadecabacter jejudonensis]
MTLLTRTDADHIAHLTLNSPDNLNALSDAMLVALQTELDALKTDKTIRAVILSGAGKAFCAGHDLKEMQAARQNADGGTVAWRDLFDRCATMMQTVQSLPQPVIAQVHGIATAAGCQLVATCDMAVAADTTRFGVNGVNIGLFCSTPMVALTRNVPRKQAFEMLTTGRFLLASEAREIGLINRTVPDSELAQHTRDLALTVAQKLPAAVTYGKEAFYAQAQMTTADAYAYTGDVMVQNMADVQTNEGITAFLEKRPPNWT